MVQFFEVRPRRIRRQALIKARIIIGIYQREICQAIETNSAGRLSVQQKKF
jgi:hypothetical protein